MQYSLIEFNKIQMQGFSYDLDKTTLDIVKNIAKLVGDDSYIKTPNFEKKRQHYKKKRKQINDDEWKIMRDFKVTTIEKKEGIEEIVNKIRGHINKISKNTYDKEFNNVLQILNDNNLINNEIHMNRIVNSIYDTITKSTFNSDLYAKMYYNLSKTNKIMKEKINKEYYELYKFSDSIQFYDPNVDYDKFCDNNKENERKKSTIGFYSNLLLNNMISGDDIFKLFEHFVNFIVQQNINNVEKKHANEQVIEWIYILITNCYENLIMDDDWDDIYEIFETVSEYKSKDYDGLTSKIIFKFMDIIEFIEENE